MYLDVTRQQLRDWLENEVIINHSSQKFNYNMINNTEDFTFEFEVPGFNKNEISANIKDGTLTVVAKNDFLIGLPVRIVLLFFIYFLVFSKLNATVFDKRDKNLFALPGITFCSCIKTGFRKINAAKTAGADT